LRVPLALGMRLWQVLGYFGLYLLTLAGALAMRRPAQLAGGVERPRIAFWVQSAFGCVLAAYLIFMSVVGGAVLARYMLPVVPLLIMAWVSTLWRRVRYWKLIVAAVAIAFVSGLFSNPPYGFSLEDNLAYRDYVVIHVEAERFLAERFPGAHVLTAWPASDELTRPWLGYVGQGLPTVRVEDFSAEQVELAALGSEPAHSQNARATGAPKRFDVALVFSTKYQPAHALFADWDWWRSIKEKFFGYHRDLLPEEIAERLGGVIVYRKEVNGQWVGVIAVR